MRRRNVQGSPCLRTGATQKLLSERVVQSMLDGDQALGILKELDQRQDQILKEIDDLNGRIEALLDAFQASRAAKTEPSSVHSLNGLPQESGSLVFTKKAA